MNGPRRLVISALSVSQPGTMGGNTKIALEAARHLPALGWSVEVVLPEDRLATFTENIGASPDGVRFTTVAPFPGNDLKQPFASARHFSRELATAFGRIGVGAGDVVFATCNFHYEILPLVRLKRRLGFTYLPSHFLFTPFIFENIACGYRFPPLKYMALWIYERMFFRKARRAADGFIVTNDTDLRNFPASFRDRVFAFYGGVNVEQIPDAPAEKTRDVVFCSRLHPQKGLDGFLDAWKIVLNAVPGARLTVIGNGDPAYEDFLRCKAARLGIAGSVEWLGYVNNEEKYAIYASAKVYVHPTVFDNNGMVAAEALCTGLPVVMFDLTPLRDVYREGCVKVPRGDKRAFADAVAGLLADPARRAAAAPSPAQIAALRERWAWRRRVSLFRDFLESLQ